MFQGVYSLCNKLSFIRTSLLVVLNCRNFSQNSEWQMEQKSSTRKLHYIKLHIEEQKSAHNRYRQYKVKVSPLCTGYVILTQGHLIMKNQQHACGYQTLTIKHCLQVCLNRWKAEENIISRVYKTLLERRCEVEKRGKNDKEQCLISINYFEAGKLINN